ncbi:MAG: ABC transporter permease subunit [Verrucomicrobia bacterium]|nr:ABC transporter permease subunit [Verrucomicrobiota bacterium]
MNRVPFSPLRVGLIARNTLLEAVRQKLFNFLLLLALAMVAGVQGLRDFNFGAPELKFLTDFGFGAMAFFGSALTIVATAQLFFSEIEQRTALTLLAKPVWRAELLLGKWLGVGAVVAAFCAVLTVVLAGLLWWREGALLREFPEAFPQGRVTEFSAVAAAAWLQWVKFAVLAAFTLLVASFAQTQLYTVAAGFFVLVICHLQYLAQEAYARDGGAAMRVVAGGIGLMFPNFQLFDVADQLGRGAPVAWSGVALTTLYGLVYAAAASGLAIFSFRKREI